MVPYSGNWKMIFPFKNEEWKFWGIKAVSKICHYDWISYSQPVSHLPQVRSVFTLKSTQTRLCVDDGNFLHLFYLSASSFRQNFTPPLPCIPYRKSGSPGTCPRLDNPPRLMSHSHMRPISLQPDLNSIILGKFILILIFLNLHAVFCRNWIIFIRAFN